MKASVWIASGTDASGQTQYVAQDYFLPAGFWVFAPELIEPPTTAPAIK